MRGVYMGTNIDGHDLDAPMFEPILGGSRSLICRLLHPLQTIGGKRLGVFYLNNFPGNRIDTAIAAAHLIFGGSSIAIPSFRSTYSKASI